MAEYAGSAMYLAWVYSGGTVRLDQDSRNFTWAPTMNFIDATAGSDTFEQLLTSFGTGQEITVPLLAQSDGTIMHTALARSTTGTLIFAPEGTATGKRKYTIPCTSMGLAWNSPYNDVTEITGQFRQTSDFSSTVY